MFTYDGEEYEGIHIAGHPFLGDDSTQSVFNRVMSRMSPLDYIANLNAPNQKIEIIGAEFADLRSECEAYAIRLHNFANPAHPNNSLASAARDADQLIRITHLLSRHASSEDERQIAIDSLPAVLYVSDLVAARRFEGARNYDYAKFHTHRILRNIPQEDGFKLSLFPANQYNETLGLLLRYRGDESISFRTGLENMLEQLDSDHSKAKQTGEDRSVRKASSPYSESIAGKIYLANRWTSNPRMQNRLRTRLGEKFVADYLRTESQIRNHWEDKKLELFIELNHQGASLSEIWFSLLLSSVFPHYYPVHKDDDGVHFTLPQKRKKPRGKPCTVARITTSEDEYMSIELNNMDYHPFLLNGFHSLDNILRIDRWTVPILTPSSDGEMVNVALAAPKSQ